MAGGKTGDLHHGEKAAALSSAIAHASLHPLQHLIVNINILQTKCQIARIYYFGFAFFDCLPIPNVM
jgi:hypothetical protein